MHYEYLVGRGGSPRDTYTRFTSLEEAMAFCLLMGIEQAEYDPEYDPLTDIDIYGDNEETGWGACPAGDDGSYWPEVIAVLEED